MSDTQVRLAFNCEVSSGRYARLLFTNVWYDHYLWLLLALAGFVALSIVDIRFIVVAMMMLFVALPMVLALLYFNYLLTPETRWSIVEKRVEVMADGLRLSFFDEKTRPVVITRQQVAGLFATGDLIVVKLAVRKYQYFVVPEAAFENKKQQEMFLAALV